MNLRNGQTPTKRGRGGLGAFVLVVASISWSAPSSAHAAGSFSFFAEHVGKTGARKGMRNHIRGCRKANRTVTECAVRRKHFPGFFSKATVAFGESQKLFSIWFYTRPGDAESIPKAMRWLDVDKASMSRAKMVFGRLISQGSTRGGLSITMSSSQEGVLYVVSAAN